LVDGSVSGASDGDGLRDASAGAEGSPPTEAGGDVTGTDVAGDGSDGGDGFVCDPKKHPKDDPCVLGEPYGVFVAAQANGGNDAAGDGSRASPYATIGTALQHLGGKTRVYVCNGDYAEQVTLTVAVSLYGGLGCPGAASGAAWSYVGGLAQVNSPSPDFAIKIDGVQGAISIEDLGFTAPNAIGQDAKGNGRSSIAALLNASTVHLTRVTLTAGTGTDGAAGTDGASTPNYSGGVNASSGSAGAMPDGGTGAGTGGANGCRNGDSSGGGAGGGAGIAASSQTGGDGQSGSSAPPAPATPGRDGAGGRGGQFACGVGPNPGADGAPNAKGSAASAYGALSASGWVSSWGGDGQVGAPGQGGGGGGGLSDRGGSGGGAGGCGGSGGTGGKGGGGSIALASVGATVVLTQCTLRTSVGGSGGAGGRGQDGQGGGSSQAGQLGCSGNVGGNGAGGSGGAGGTGGLSVGILYSGTPPAFDPLTVFTTGMAGAQGARGAKGNGGTTPVIGPGKPGNDGDPGHLGLSQGMLGS
jgi:hypothetical protein